MFTAGGLVRVRQQADSSHGNKAKCWFSPRRARYWYGGRHPHGADDAEKRWGFYHQSKRPPTEEHARRVEKQGQARGVVEGLVLSEYASPDWRGTRQKGSDAGTSTLALDTHLRWLLAAESGTEANTHSPEGGPQQANLGRQKTVGRTGCAGLIGSICATT